MGTWYIMCKICVELCKEIEEIYGHKVNPSKLAILIESSPIAELLEKHKEHEYLLEEPEKTIIDYIKQVFKWLIQLIPRTIKWIMKQIDDILS